MSSNPDLDVLLTPLGGGGLLSGSSISAKTLNPKIKVIGTEPELADDGFRSFQSGNIEPVIRTDTANGLRTSVGDLPFQIIKQHVDEIVTVSEESIIEAMRFIWERMNMIIEPSCAVPVAAIFEGKSTFGAKKWES